MEEKKVMDTMPNRKTADMRSTYDAESIMVKKQIGKATFLVRVHFSENSKETLQDKIQRLLMDEVRGETFEKPETHFSTT